MSTPRAVQVLAWCAALSVTSASIFTQQQVTQLQSFVARVMACSQIPGLSLAVVRGEERWTEGYGVEDVSSGRPVSSASLFGVGSLTKAFTVSLLALFLNETSGLSWETPLSAILGPDFRLADDYVTKHVTLTDLLTHRTGLCASNLPFMAGFPDTMTSALFEKRIRHLPLSTAFRGGFVYNNWMYTLAGRVAEVLGGASWEELLHTRLLQPMGMLRTKTFTQASRTQSNDTVATGHLKFGDKPTPLDSIFGDDRMSQICGGLVTSADDMSLWMHVLLGRGVAPDGTRVLPESCVTDMQTPRILPTPPHVQFLNKPRFPASYADLGYGFAWFIAQYRGYTLVWSVNKPTDLLSSGYHLVHHPGLFPGYHSLLALFPDLGTGVFIAINGSDYKNTVKAIFYYIADLLLGLSPWLTAETACSFPEPWLLSGADTEAYTGSYGNRLLGDAIVSEVRGTGLLLRLNRLRARLHRTANDSVLVARPLGSRGLLLAAVDKTTRLSLRAVFRDVGGDGRYRELLLDAGGLFSAWSFQRGVWFDGDSPDCDAPPSSSSFSSTSIAAECVASMTSEQSSWPSG
ncbi:uncharacterized protein LOC143288243 [Babylonia areolata]|uniref:uncharacterized protein LOC143288243 n=1 Tax=Babylonia areolata TaxID=304850 RepID=UPI003FD1A896